MHFKIMFLCFTFPFLTILSEPARHFWNFVEPRKTRNFQVKPGPPDYLSAHLYATVHPCLTLLNLSQSCICPTNKKSKFLQLMN